MQELGEVVFLLSTVPDTTGIASNEFLYQQIKDQPERMFGFYSIRTDHWNINSQMQLEKLEADLIKYNAHGITSPCSPANEIR